MCTGLGIKPVGYQFPAPGTAVRLTIQPESLASELSAAPAGAEVTPFTGGLQVTWPDDNTGLTLVDGAGHPFVAIPPPAPVPLIHEKQWWNLLLGNPIGYLPAATPVKAVFMELPVQRYLNLGPPWLGHWLTVFFSALVVSALLTKVIPKIN